MDIAAERMDNRCMDHCCASSDLAAGLCVTHNATTCCGQGPCAKSLLSLATAGGTVLPHLSALSTARPYRLAR